VQALAQAVLTHRLMLVPKQPESIAPRSSRTPSRGSGPVVRSALGCVALGLVLLLVAATFDAEPLYVTGSALLLLGAGAIAWIRVGAWGATVSREVAVAASWRVSR
jgi:hypothetical protein